MLRCINCFLCIERGRKHSVTRLQLPLRNLLASWKELLQLPREAKICHQCYLLLDRHCSIGNKNAVRELGHRQVCLGCGIRKRTTKEGVEFHTLEPSDPLVLTILSWDLRVQVTSNHASVCNPCWIRAKQILPHYIQDLPGTRHGKIKPFDLEMSLQPPTQVFEGQEMPVSSMMCRVCFASNCKLNRMTELCNLNMKFTELTNIPLSVVKHGVIPPYLCIECTQRLLKSAQLRSQSLQSQTFLLEAYSNHGCTTLQSVQSVIGPRVPIGSQLKISPTTHLDINVTIKEEKEELEFEEDKYETDDIIHIKQGQEDTYEIFNDVTDQFAMGRQFNVTENGKFELYEELEELQQLTDHVDEIKIEEEVITGVNGNIDYDGEGMHLTVIQNYWSEEPEEENLSVADIKVHNVVSINDTVSSRVIVSPLREMQADYYCNDGFEANMNLTDDILDIQRERLYMDFINSDTMDANDSEQDNDKGLVKYLPRVNRKVKKKGVLRGKAGVKKRVKKPAKKIIKGQSKDKFVQKIRPKLTDELVVKIENSPDNVWVPVADNMNAPNTNLPETSLNQKPSLIGCPPKPKRGRPKSDKSRQEIRREINRRYRKTHPDIVREIQKRYALKHPEAHRRAVLRYEQKRRDERQKAKTLQTIQSVIGDEFPIGSQLKVSKTIHSDFKINVKKETEILELEEDKNETDGIRDIKTEEEDAVEINDDVTDEYFIGTQ